MTKRRLADFYKKQSYAKGSLLAWHKNTSTATWQNLVELKETFPTESLAEPLCSGRRFANRMRIASAVINGHRQLTVEHIEKLSEFFHVSPAVFFPQFR